MPYTNADFAGDAVYDIKATGDCVTGDNVRFQRAVFAGSYKKPHFSHLEIVTGIIVNDSYGTDKQQHTFTLELEDGRKSTIKGRNLYRNGVWRKPWVNEALRGEALDEKHNRGDNARSTRDLRRAGGY